MQQHTAKRAWANWSAGRQIGVQIKHSQVTATHLPTPFATSYWWRCWPSCFFLCLPNLSSFLCVTCPCSFWTKCHANLLVNNNNSNNHKHIAHTHRRPTGSITEATGQLEANHRHTNSNYILTHCVIYSQQQTDRQTDHPHSQSASNNDSTSSSSSSGEMKPINTEIVKLEKHCTVTHTDTQTTHSCCTAATSLIYHLQLMRLL